jgi:hypothetical protein
MRKQVFAAALAPQWDLPLEIIDQLRPALQAAPHAGTWQRHTNDRGRLGHALCGGPSPGRVIKHDSVGIGRECLPNAYFFMRKPDAKEEFNMPEIVGYCRVSTDGQTLDWADTTTPHGRLMLTILGGLAEFERSLIKARTDVGIKRAREAGIRFGRPPKLTRHQQAQALKLLDHGEPQSAVARLLNVDQSTISRLASRVAA